MMTTTIKRYCERHELKNQGIFDCLECPSEEIKDRIRLDRRREDKHVIHKTSSKKFKANPHVAYAYSQMPTNESSQLIIPESSAGSGSRARANCHYKPRDLSQEIDCRACAACEPATLCDSSRDGPGNETYTTHLRNCPFDIDFPKLPSHLEPDIQTLNPSNQREATPTYTYLCCETYRSDQFDRFS
ncbi:hypothetical protein FMUND_8780 [Fusarium mundagurra]|uniref:Uncharacterized protein n=1 Tax=Fusarium mundagurra TaxID=1567541 RepID=A0A8H6DE73_9HYPO|nr:hypothetical protein FMUND_8780 [Fusarium mundagurra]